jgi:hypothetical protein
MSRTNRKHDRQIERKRRNKGPELFSQAADNELQQKADQLAKGLSKATINHGDVAAAGLLLTLAESAYKDNPAAFERAFSLAERWSKEPQVAMLETGPRLPVTPPVRQLTDGSQAGEEKCGEDDSRSTSKDLSDEILDAEWEMAPGDGAP